MNVSQAFPTSLGFRHLKNAIEKLAGPPVEQVAEIAEFAQLYQLLCRRQGREVADQTMSDIAAYYNHAKWSRKSFASPHDSPKALKAHA